MKYESFQYLFPPRPQHKISLKTIATYDNGQYFAQPKLNGSNGMLFIDPSGKWTLWNRHNEKMTLYNDKIQFGKLHRGNGWMVLNGEYMNKSKKDANGKTFNHKFIIFDILVYEGEILVGKTYEQRAELLEKLYPCQQFRISDTGVEYDPYLCQTDVEDIYKAPNFMGGFADIYNKIVSIDMYEGLVIKRRTAPLEPLFREGNNSGYMVKIRKETKNYRM